MILADFTSGQQLAVEHLVEAGTAVSILRVPDSSKNVNELESPLAEYEDVNNGATVGKIWNHLANPFGGSA